jgi:hypothetical protein
VFDPLCRGNESGVANGGLLGLTHGLFALVDQSFHSFELVKDLFQPFGMLLGLLQVLLECAFQFLGSSSFSHIG